MFRNPATVNYRAIRDMGLAAWWGSSLMGLAGLVPAAQSQQDLPDQHRVLDAGWRGSRGFLTGAITAYLVGTGLVRFDGHPLEANGKPKWMTEGVESPARTTAVVTALVGAIGAKRLRAREAKVYEQGEPLTAAQRAEAESLRKKAHALHVLTPMATGWLMYSHLKESVRK